MSALTFSLKAAPSQRLDLSKLTPGRLKDMKPAEIQRIAIGTTRQPLLVGDIFVVKGGDAAEIRFDGGSDRFDLLGHGMESGVIRVEGDVGPKAGRRMRGGEIEIRGGRVTRAVARRVAAAIREQLGNVALHFFLHRRRWFELWFELGLARATDGQCCRG